MTTFGEYFKAATGHGPYPYQRRLAEEDPPPQILNIPTGARKTAAVAAGLDGGGHASMPLTPIAASACGPKMSRSRAAREGR